MGKTVTLVPAEDFERFVTKVMNMLNSRDHVPVRMKRVEAIKYLGCGKYRFSEYVKRGKITPFYDDLDLNKAGKPRDKATMCFYRDELDKIVAGREIRLKVRIS